MKKLLMILLFLFIALPILDILSEAEAFADQVDTAWVRRYNGPNNLGDVSQAIAVDGSGDCYHE